MQLSEKVLKLRQRRLESVALVRSAPVDFLIAEVRPVPARRPLRLVLARRRLRMRRLWCRYAARKLGARG